MNEESKGEEMEETVRETAQEVVVCHEGKGEGRVVRVMRGVMGVVLSGRGAVIAWRVVIVVELCVLGVGVVRRLEDSYDRAMEAARMELAVLEAQEWQEEENTAGSAGIGAREGEETTGKEMEESEVGTDEAPDLRPRDVATIISEETGDMAAAAAALEREGEGGETSEEGGTMEIAAEKGEIANAGQLSAEQDEEVESLIRQGVAAMTAGDMKKCILSLEQASTMAPNHPAMLYYYGMAYDKLLNPRKARDYYGKLFRMREQAGKYFARASRRLTYGMEQPSAMRGKLSFGPHQVQHTYDTEQGESVSILLPVLLAPGEEVRPDDIYITIQFFDLVNGRRVDFSRVTPKLAWVNEKPTWNDWEEDLMVNYAVAPADGMDVDSAGDVKYYGFTAKLYYKGEPLDCISTPSALILHEQRLNSRRRGMLPGGLLPDDGLSPYTEEAVPYSDEYNDTSDTNL